MKNKILFWNKFFDMHLLLIWYEIKREFICRSSKVQMVLGFETQKPNQKTISFSNYTRSFNLLHKKLKAWFYGYASNKIRFQEIQ